MAPNRGLSSARRSGIDVLGRVLGVILMGVGSLTILAALGYALNEWRYWQIVLWCMGSLGLGALGIGISAAGRMRPKVAVVGAAFSCFAAALLTGALVEFGRECLVLTVLAWVGAVASLVLALRARKHPWVGAG